MPAKTTQYQLPNLTPNRLIEKSTELSVNIKISCEKLPVSPILTQAIPKVFAFINKELLPTKQSEADFITEHIFDNENPEFEKQIELKFELGVEYYIRFIVVNTLDLNSTDFSNQEILGEFNLKFTDLILKNPNVIKGYLKEIETNDLTPFIIKLELIQQPISQQLVKIGLKAQNIIKQNIIGVTKYPSTYFVIYKQLNNECKWSPVYSTPIVENSSNPEWALLEVPFASLCKGDMDMPLKFELREALNSKDAFPLLATAELSLNLLNQNLNTAIPLIATRLLKQAEPPTLTPTYFEMDNSSLSFIDYLQAGMRFNCQLSIDLTRSNLHPSNIKSFHYKPEESAKDNSYERILKGVIEKIAPYTLEKEFKLFGFGCKNKFTGEIEHCVKLGEEYQDKLIGMNCIIEAYNFALERFDLWGPTSISPIIEESIRMSRTQNNPNIDYNLSFIITDGLISDEDLDDMLESIVDSTKYPLSIVFLVIGDHYNKKFREVISSGHLIKGKHNRVATRVNTCFFQLPDPIPTKGIKKIIGQYISVLPSHISQFMKYRQLEIMHFKLKNKESIDLNYGETNLNLKRVKGASYDKSYSMGQDSYFVNDNIRDSLKSDDMNRSRAEADNKATNQTDLGTEKRQIELSAILSDDDTHSSQSARKQSSSTNASKNKLNGSNSSRRSPSDSIEDDESTSQESQTESEFSETSEGNKFNTSYISDISVPPNSEFSMLMTDVSKFSANPNNMHSADVDTSFNASNPEHASKRSTLFDMSSLLSVPPNSDTSNANSIVIDLETQDITLDLNPNKDISTILQSTVNQPISPIKEQCSSHDSGVDESDGEDQEAGVSNVNRTKNLQNQSQMDDFIEV